VCRTTSVTTQGLDNGQCEYREHSSVISDVFLDDKVKELTYG